MKLPRFLLAGPNLPGSAIGELGAAHDGTIGTLDGDPLLDCDVPILRSPIIS
ncbi:hypothetical protein [Acinetobacter sp. ANC 4558]|uniref:hypothetical protein n=1 Tax=Acinetobacter sp. ANC 4558 TaxID=1977876 RepID=UPI001BB46931|nr:hypothetical protein [Acinetobacter sp. ANC 4558]